LVVALFLFFSACGAYKGIGDRLDHTYLHFNVLPLSTSDATKAGWTPLNTQCDPNLGFGYQAQGGFSEAQPILLYFSAAGQISGLGVVHYGAPLTQHLKFWRPFMNATLDAYLMTVHFRAPSVLCSKTMQPEELGSQVVINQGTVNFAVPLTDSEATNQKWTIGNCIYWMGTHWALDLMTGPVLSFKAEQVLPFMPMYYDGTMSAFLVDTAVAQKNPSNYWEGPLPPTTMCGNFCDGKNCPWDSAETFTLHFFLRNHTSSICSSQCNPGK